MTEVRSRAGDGPKAIAQAGVEAIGQVYSSMNGENYFAKEFGVMIIRNRDTIAVDFDVLHPADCFGDIGAAVVTQVRAPRGSPAPIRA